jgi:hypothetical protein
MPPPDGTADKGGTMKPAFAISVLIALAVLDPVRAQVKPVFLGAWKMDVTRSDTPKLVPWYQRQELLTITSTATELRIERPGSLPLTYRLDGSEQRYDEGSGDLARQVRTQLVVTGATLMTRATLVRQDRDPKSRAVSSAVGVTDIEVYTLLAGGVQLVVERSAQRQSNPPTLPGFPFDSSIDPLVHKYTDVFQRASTG